MDGKKEMSEIKYPEPTEGGQLPTVFSSQTLLKGQKEVLIRHGGETYRLRHTRQGKLILTK